LLRAGLLKVWFHLNTATTLRIPGCLGTEFSIVLSSSPPGLAHCWGCYVALFGIFIIGASAASRLAGDPAAKITDAQKAAQKTR